MTSHFRFPEWNHETRSYGESDEVIVNEVKPGNRSCIEIFERDYGALCGILSRRMQQHVPRSTILERRVQQGHMNQRYVLPEVIKGYGGEIPSQRVFDKRRRVAMKSADSSAIGLLLDQSGSTRFLVSENYSRIDLIKDATFMLGRAIRQFNDSFFVFSYHSSEDVNPTFAEGLKFEHEPWSSQVEERIASIDHTAGTYNYNNKDGAAIRFANERLLNTSCEHMHLFLLTDGAPNCDDTYYEDRFAYEDTRQALAEGKAQGINNIYLTINPEYDAQEFISHVFEETVLCKRYTNLSDIYEDMVDIYEMIREERI
ncbi:MAG: hypothetical protein R6V53_00750 [Candidatus Woesearchaeota archaeon]